MIYFDSTKYLNFRMLVLYGCILAGLTSCNNYKEADSIAREQMVTVNPKRDTVFSVVRQSLYDAVDITFKGTLSDTSIIAVSTDSTFINKATYYVSSPKIAFSHKMNLNGIRNNLLYIKYHPIRNSNSGHAKIGVAFL